MEFLILEGKVGTAFEWVNEEKCSFRGSENSFRRGKRTNGGPNVVGEGGSRF